jgi:hypothetical protein
MTPFKLLAAGALATIIAMLLCLPATNAGPRLSVKVSA